MKRSSKSSVRVYHGEEGLYLIATALVLVALLAFLLVQTLETPYLTQHSKILRIKVDRICQKLPTLVSRSQYFLALETFADGIAELQDDGEVVTKAALILLLRLRNQSIDEAR